MAVTEYQRILIFVQCITGLVNIPLKNWAVGLESPGSDGIERKFDHPFVQCWFIFLGEILCLIMFKIIFKYCPTRQAVDITEIQDESERVYFRRVVYSQEEKELIRGTQNFNPLLFFPPAILCMIATSIVYVGLRYAPSFQTLLGLSIVFVAVLSRRPFNLMPFSIMMVGLIIIGLDNVLGSKEDHKDTNGLITGVLLIIMAQIITTLQIVYEEKYLIDEDISPLQAVGWEGVFGFVVTSLLLIPFYFVEVGYPFAKNARGVLEDFPDAMIQIYNNLWLLVSCVGIVISTAFCNFAEISLTKEVSAVSGVIINVIICLGCQVSNTPQIIGFILFMFGVIIYFQNLFSASSASEESMSVERSSLSESDESIS